MSQDLSLKDIAGEIYKILYSKRRNEQRDIINTYFDNAPSFLFLLIINANEKILIYDVAIVLISYKSIYSYKYNA